MNAEKFIRIYGPWAIGVLFLAVSLSPLFVRISNDAPIISGSTSYEQLRMAELIIEGTPSYDPLYDTSINQTPFTFLLALFILAGAAWLLPVVLSAVLIMLFYLFCKRFSSTHFAILASVIFIVSPTFSVFSSTLEPLLLSVICVLGAWLLFRYSFVSAGLLLFLSIITVPIFGFVVTFALLIWFASSRSSNSLGVMAALLAGLLLARPSSFILFEPNVLFELGHRAGISVFLVIFAVFGLFSQQAGKKEAVIVVALSVLTILLPALLPLLVMTYALIASYGIIKLADEKWELELLRQSLLVLVICIGLLLIILSIRERAGENPTSSFSNAAAYLEKGYRPGSILTDPAHASMISYLGGRHVQRGLVPLEILRSRDANKVYDYLESTGTSHVMITAGMREDLFERTDEGILFLLPNTKRFVVVHESEEVEIWYYIPR